VLKVRVAKDFFLGGGVWGHCLRNMSDGVFEGYRTPLPYVKGKKGTKRVEGCHTFP